MSDPARKDQLLRDTRQEYARLEALLTSLSPQEVEQPALVGSWSAKDTLAHLAWWQRAVVSEITSGVELDPGLQGQPWDTDRANLLVVEASRAQPLDHILAELRASYVDLLTMLAHIPDARLADQATYDFIAGNTTHHYREHREAITAALARGGGAMSP